MNVRTSITVLCVSLLSLSLPVHAQSPVAPEDPVDRLFEELRDDSRSVAVRAAAIARLLAEGGEPARAGLAELLASEDSSEELRLLIVVGSLTASGCPLLDRVVDLVAAPDAEFAGKVRRRFKDAGRPALVKALAGRITAEGVPEDRAKLLIGLLGDTERKEAVPVLLDLWEKGEGAVADAASAALLVIIPERFPTVADARAFWEENGHLGLVDIRGKLLRTKLNGEKKDPAVGPLVGLAEKTVGNAPLRSLIDDYLKFADLPEIRRIGAEQMAKYPFEAREGERAAEARKTAATALLDGLDTETDDDVALAMLGAARTLTKSLLALNPERTVHVITRRLPSDNREVRLAAVATLGDLGDRRAIADLIRQFDGAPATDPEYRLAVLNALELIRNAQDVSNGGMSKWILARLEGGDEDEEILLRLIQFLRYYEKLDDAVPPLAALLRESKSKSIRQTAAGTLGLLGARHGEPAAIEALGVAGLSDPDASVRAVSATQLGRAPADKVPENVKEALLERLSEREKEKRVRTAAGLSLLRISGIAALEKMGPMLSDDEFWTAAVIPYLETELLSVDVAEKATSYASRAAGFVRALRMAKNWGRCADAARRVLDAPNLVWEKEAAGKRKSVILDLGFSLESSGRSKDALDALAAEALPKNPTDPESYDLLLMFARLQRANGKADEAVKQLDALIASATENPVPGIGLERARLEQGRARLDLSQWKAARVAVQPILEHPDLGAEARKVDQTAATEEWILALDGTDPAVVADAVAGLKSLGKAVWPRLDKWLTARENDPERAAAAVGAIAQITGKPLTFDATATPEEQKKAIAAAHAALKS